MEGIRIIDQGLQAAQVCPEDQPIQGIFQSLVRFLDVRFQSVATLCIDVLCALVRFFKAFVAAFGKELGVNLGCNLQELSEGIHIALFKFEILNRFDQAFPRRIDLRLCRPIILIYLLRRSPCLQEILPCRICKAGQLFFRNRICYIQSSLQNGLIDHRKLEIQFGIFIWHGDRVRETVRLEGDRFSIAGNRAEYTVHRREVQLQRFVRHHLCAVNAVAI